ncbi:MAG TPA: hypothetical protein VMW28_08585 [Pelolinea sp.]|nr:hypothetical protein [Pelolinea sp.]
MDIVYKILPVLGAGFGAFLIFLLGQKLSGKVFKQKASKRVKDLMGVDDKKKKVKPTDFGSEEYKIRLAFIRYGIDVYKRENLALNIARLFLALLFTGGMHFIFNLPMTTSMVGMVGGFLIANSLATNAWKKLCTEIEKEIPIFLSGFTSTIQVNPNVLQAVEEESTVLALNSPLKRWLQERFVRLGQDKGIVALDELVEEAFRVSNSLGVMIFLVGRLWKTGGMEWKRSFALAASNLEGVMEARMMGLAAGSSAKNAVKVIIFVTMFIILVMARNPVFASSMSSPVVQGVYAMTTLMMIFGYGFMGNMIDDKL